MYQCSFGLLSLFLNEGLRFCLLSILNVDFEIVVTVLTFWMQAFVIGSLTRTATATRPTRVGG
jgi:hypothetical protein